MDSHQLDPKGLMKDAYCIDGITEPECRSIFLDWALSMPIDAEPKVWIGEVIEKYAAQNPDHPMTRVLKEGLAEQPAPRRRGGRSARKRDAEQ